jgi:Family of unknown function (DUF5681)
VGSKANENYEVGYGKPPKATRFQKGKSGNPSGRSKKRHEKDTGKILQFIDNEELVVTVDGRRKRMPKAEVHFRQLFTRAIKGDLPAARLIAKLSAQYFGPEARGPSEVKFQVCPTASITLRRKNPTEAKENP